MRYLYDFDSGTKRGEKLPDMAARLLSQVDSTATHHPGQEAPGKRKQLLPASYERVPGSHASPPGTQKGFGPLGKSLT